jgi:hypothetical protein
MSNAHQNWASILEREVKEPSAYINLTNKQTQNSGFNPKITPGSRLLIQDEKQI